MLSLEQALAIATGVPQVEKALRQATVVWVSIASRGVPGTTVVRMEDTASYGTTVTSLQIVSLRSSVPLVQPAPPGVYVAVTMLRRVRNALHQPV